MYQEKSTGLAAADE